MPPSDVAAPPPRTRAVERATTAAWAAVTVLLLAGSLAAVVHDERPVGQRLDARTVFATARRLEPATTVRIVVRQTTRVEGQPDAVSTNVTDLDFEERRGRSATETPVPVEVRFGERNRWLRVVTPSPATQGRRWIRVPVGRGVPPAYDFDARADPSGGAETVLGAAEVFELPGREVAGRRVRVFRIDFDVDRLASRVRPERREAAVAPFGVLDTERLELTAAVDDEGRLVRVHYVAPLREATPPAQLEWEATYTYDGPVDVSPPAPADSLTVRDPQRAAQLAGTVSPR